MKEIIRLVLVLGILVFIVFLALRIGEKLAAARQVEVAYDKMWQEVDMYQGQGLPKSALGVLDKIYEAARKDNDAGQWIKALVYKFRYLGEVEEEAFFKIYTLAEAELSKSQFPVKQVLHSMLAEGLWNYYRNNRYRFLQRTQTEGVKDEDMRTWDLGKIVEQVVYHYRHSLDEADKARQTKIDILDRILYPDMEGRKYRPSVYDFLAHRAIDFYLDSESGLTRPANYFSLDKSEYLAGVADFARLEIETEEPLSFHYQALKLLQDLIRSHLADKEPGALVDVDLKRLRFVYREGVMEEKELLYEDALKTLVIAYEGQGVAADVSHDLAVLYHGLGDKYKPQAPGTGITADKYRWHKKLAGELCRQVLKKYPGSPGARNCFLLLAQIEDVKLDLTLERAVSPDKPFLGLLKYQNAKQVYFRIVKTNWQELADQGQNPEYKMAAYFIAKKPVRTFSIAVPDDGDFQSHSLEFKNEPLKTGEYLVMAADTEDFNYKDHGVVFAGITVSNIAYVNRNWRSQGLEFLLLDRETGKPLTGAMAQAWHQQYSQKTGRYILTKGETYKPDAHGYLSIPVTPSSRNYFRLEFINGLDSLFPQQEFYSYRSSPEETKKKQTFFFTDRAIYRPGQTLHFKGLLVEKDSERPGNARVIPNYPAVVRLFDVNRQKVNELSLVSNEFGTFSGTFVLPLAGLTGEMQIADNYGQTQFSVEEYKRPKFYLSYNPLAESYRLGDTVAVKGKALAYAGYPIDRAKVKFRVVRQVFYPYPWYYWDFGPRSEPQIEILNGLTETDAGGEFEVRFQAKADAGIDKETLPAFRFRVFAEVTDINGETQQAETGVAIGYTALKFNINLDDQVNKDPGEKTLQLSSTTLSGDPVKAVGQVSFYRLGEPGHIHRPKLWKNPDRFTISEEEYHLAFPHDAYGDEADQRTWKREPAAFQGGFDTGQGTEIKLTGLNKWKTGRYLMEIESKDKYGTPVKEIRYFTLYSLAEDRMPYTELDWFAVPKPNVEPGNDALVVIGSSDQDVTVIYELEQNGQILEKKYLTIAKEQKIIRVPIKEEHRGNLVVHVLFVRHNRFLSHSQVITVPWSNKQLDISFETFRNKLLPGQKEEWRIKIQGKKGEATKTPLAAPAEMLATLYDASLDAFRFHNWSFWLYPTHYTQSRWQGNNYFEPVEAREIRMVPRVTSYVLRGYDRLNWFNFYWWNAYYMRATKAMAMPAVPPGQRDSAPNEMAVGAAAEVEAGVVGGVMPAPMKKEAKKDGETPAEKASTTSTAQVTPRTNFQETAFFYPHLRTAADGTIIIAFTVPEALTTWKMLGFAHTRELEYGLVTKELVTQKELMAVPNLPRFLREGDTLELGTKIVNLSDKELSGKASLSLFDAVTLQPVDARFQNLEPDKDFSVKKGESARVLWKIAVPEGVEAVSVRIVAKAGRYADGEEQPLPILKNRLLVTESLPLPVRGGQTRDFTFQKLIDSGQSSTLRHHRLTLEFTANPVWYAVQALPYLMEYPYECLEQTFSRYYANSLAGHIVNQKPEIKRVFEQWKNLPDKSAFLSNLEKNQELKGLLLEETPWVIQAQNEGEQKKRIALLFDLTHMAGQTSSALQKLKEGQMPSGAWPWFLGMHESRYITQHIVCGFGHLDRLKAVPVRQNPLTWAMIGQALPYLDRAIQEDYDWLIRHEVKLDQMNIGYTQVHYLYARSFFTDIPVDDKYKKAFDYYKGQAVKYWTKFRPYLQGMIALSLHRFNDRATPAAIVRSLEEYALHSDEMGMYWKDEYGYYWYQAPIETQALLIEVFAEAANDLEAVDEMKIWLLKQKQTQDWRTTKATAEACYALLLQGSDWLSDSQLPVIGLGRQQEIKVDPTQLDGQGPEPGTGYFKTAWAGKEITPALGYIQVKNPNRAPAWGALYWQYFENLDKITPAKTPLSLKKQLLVERPSDKGPVLMPLDQSPLKVGDRVKVRLEIRVDRDMEYVHIKDMRASGFEPENVISHYKWQDGFGYYESTRDAATNFFIDYLAKGTYIFEYPLRVSHAGDFSNGITTIQCMYAPEFSSHSAGIRVKIAD